MKWGAIHRLKVSSSLARLGMFFLITFAVVAVQVSPAQAKRIFVSPGVGLGSPEFVTVSVMSMVSLDSWSDEVLILGADVGKGGGNLRVGYGSAFIFSDIYFAFGMTLTAVRTWGDPWNADPNESYLGPEVFAQVEVVRIHAGALYRVDGEDKTGRLIPALGIAICGWWGI